MFVTNKVLTNKAAIKCVIFWNLVIKTHKNRAKDNIWLLMEEAASHYDCVLQF